MFERYEPNASDETIKRFFSFISDSDWNAFIALDDLNCVGETRGDLQNSVKYMMFNDVLSGQFDSFVKDGDKEWYKTCSKNNGGQKMSPEFAYLSVSAKALSDFMYIKYDLGAKTRMAYKNHDKDGLRNLLADYEKAIKKLGLFYKVYRTQWLIENKPNGFEVQDIRLGGLKTRLNDAYMTIVDYLNGKIDKIDELESDILDYTGNFKNYEKRHIAVNVWSQIASVNII